MRKMEFILHLCHNTWRRNVALPMSILGKFCHILLISRMVVHLLIFFLKLAYCSLRDLGSATSCFVTLGKSRNLSKPQCPHLGNGHNDRAELLGLWGGMNETPCGTALVIFPVP